MSAALSESEMAATMRRIMSGEMPAADVESFLIELAERGETVDEITGAAKVMREMALKINAPSDAVDCCGTGGDHAGTYNISTAVALVAAGCGVPIAKHGGGASTSKSGSVDVLAALGVNFDVPPQKLEEALGKFNFCFLAAPRHHSAMKNVREIRKKIGRRTIFNLLGPLTNPAGTNFHLMGVYDKKWLEPMTEVLKNLGAQRAWVVHGSDGLDEITTTGPTHIAVLENGKISRREITPQDFGLPTSKSEDLKGGDAEENAAAMKSLLQGQKGAYRDIVLANTAAVLVIHGSAKDLKDGAAKAAHALDSGAALKTLSDYAAFTKEQSA
ncbi:MAG TPA: anthranilate phosphoribosyltransferase [Rhodospirillaceae bacterium]|nr:anthranilate phosphoribosyltransferase [Rhodospirillaceae bacterium]